MQRSVGTLIRPAGSVGAHRGDDIVACVFWRAGQARASRSLAHLGDGRITDWLARASTLVCPEQPVAYLTRLELARLGAG